MTTSRRPYWFGSSRRSARIARTEAKLIRRAVQGDALAGRSPGVAMPSPPPGREGCLIYKVFPGSATALPSSYASVSRPWDASQSRAKRDHGSHATAS